MADDPATPNAATLLRSTAIFRELSNDQLAEIWSRAKLHNLLRGDTLCAQDAPSDSVYVVVSGRFEIWVKGQASAISRGRRRRADRRDRLFLRRAPHRDHHRGARFGRARARPRIIRRRRPRGAGDLSDAAAGARPQARQRQRRQRAARRRRAHHRGDRRRRPSRSRKPSTTASTTWSDARGKGRLLTRDYLERHFPGRTARRPVGVQLAQRHRARIRADRLSGRRHAHRLDPQGDPASRSGPDRGLRHGAGGRQSGGSLRLRHPPAGAPPAGAPARASHRLGRGHGRVARRSARWGCITTYRSRTISTSRACIAS